MWKDLAPNLTRQRLIIEGTTEKIVEPAQIKDYLKKLSHLIGMKAKGEVLTYSAEEPPKDGKWSSLNMGYAGWLYWISSGVHFHSYPTNPPIFSVDAYTCKPFSVEKAVQFTKKYFNTKEIVWKDLSSRGKLSFSQ
ncbi:MAG: S-adenosylmethionine decarboxylase [Candidatus Diapherotrites archaeon]|nr:S-adenosylmethionine decarboxylase [Candidatus Diapherotrites archaeon]